MIKAMKATNMNENEKKKKQRINMEISQPTEPTNQNE